MYSRIELPARFPGAAGIPGDAGSHDATGMADGDFFRGLDHPLSVFIVRHGQSEGNARRIYQGRLEFPLDDDGRRQAHAAGEWLAARNPETILCSPQSRALETARIIGTACGREPETLDSLAEVDTGIFSGLTYEEAETLHPEIFRVFNVRSWDGVPDAEHSSSMYARAMASWSAIRQKAFSGAGSVVCVSHGGLIQWLLRTTFGGRRWLPLFPTSNCGISEYRLEPGRPEAGAGGAPGKEGTALQAGKAGFGPAFPQWDRINFRPPHSGQEARPLF